jgi:hypothetical protein
MLFKPLPTAGSSGGPIVDEESGAVVGVILGMRMDSAAVGMQGWGVPAEAIYEVRYFFSLCPELRAEPESADVCTAWIEGLNLEKCLMMHDPIRCQGYGGKMPHHSSLI